MRRGHRQPLDRIGRGQRLRPVGFEELEPAPGVAAKRSRASTRAPTGAAQGSIALFLPSSTTSFKPVGAPVRAGADFEPRHRGDRGQRLAAEAEGRDRGQVAVGNFRRRVPLDAQSEIRFVHAAPVVDDADQPSPAGLDRDLDRLRPGVERVLDQFLDRRRRPLDHLARGDAVDDKRIETANRHGGRTSRALIALAASGGSVSFRRNQPAP